ncbi:MAG: hypothetical protein GOV02_03275 [Candidatus Aenigmarchaeota archaeon]|nr:hypothetical protein [Candidatus Aenigmarchaeota archaeon]
MKIDKEGKIVNEDEIYDVDVLLGKYNKTNLAEALVASREEEASLIDNLDTKDRNYQIVKSHLSDAENEITTLQRRLSKIVSAMKTIMAVKYPNADLDGNDPTQMFYAGEEIKVDPDYESEELLFIQHLYRLSK